MALDAAHELSWRAAGIVAEVSTPEGLERVGGEELGHTPAENRRPLGMPALWLFPGQLLARLVLGALLPLLVLLLLSGSDPSVAHGKQDAGKTQGPEPGR